MEVNFQLLITSLPRIPMTKRRNSYIKFQLAQPMSLSGLFTRVWVKGHLKEQAWAKERCIIKKSNPALEYSIAYKSYNLDISTELTGNSTSCGFSFRTESLLPPVMLTAYTTQEWGALWILWVLGTIWYLGVVYFLSHREPPSRMELFKLQGYCHSVMPASGGRPSLLHSNWSYLPEASENRFTVYLFSVSHSTPCAQKCQDGLQCLLLLTIKSISELSSKILSLDIITWIVFTTIKQK